MTDTANKERRTRTLKFWYERRQRLLKQAHEDEQKARFRAQNSMLVINAIKRTAYEEGIDLT